jgi:tRNA(Ile)-lysidine synthase
VALLRLMVEARGRSASAEGKLVAVHVNHGLRGAQGDGDERFVEELAASLGVECVVGHVEPRAIADAEGDGLEAACRATRYDFLVATAQRHGARYVAVGHTADDQAETILHHVLRGTGLAGLGGMTTFRPMNDATTLVRPLLAARRADVREYLASLEQPWREDATNRERAFTRNRLRHDLLPLLARDYNADVVEALVRLGAQAREAHDVVRQLAEALAERCMMLTAGDEATSGAASKGDTVVVDCGPLAGANRHVVREMFVSIWTKQHWPRQAMGFAEWDVLAEMAMAARDERARHRTLPGDVAVERTEDAMKIARRG